MRLPLLFLLLSTPATVFGGGWTSSGGGSGVACFNTTLDKQNAQVLIDEGKPLTSDLAGRINKVELLDYFEADEKLKEEISALYPGDRDWTIHLLEAQRNVTLLAPSFGGLLEVIGKSILDKKWVEDSRLRLHQDQGRVAALPINCLFIQVMLRSSANKPSSIEGFGEIPDRVFEFEVRYNPFWFERLDSSNKMMLLIHEELYMLGQTIGHSNSSDIRYWTRELALLRPSRIHPEGKPAFIQITKEEFRKLFHGNGPETTTNNQPKAPARIRWRLVSSFGDYLMYFFEQEKADSTTPAMKRYIEYTEFIHEGRIRVEECRKDPFVRDYCLQLKMGPAAVEKSLSNTQAFVYASRFLFDRADGDFNSEYLYSRSRNGEFVEAAEEAAIDACDRLNRVELKRVNAFDPGALTLLILDKARSYCRENNYLR